MWSQTRWQVGIAAIYIDGEKRASRSGGVNLALRSCGVLAAAWSGSIIMSHPVDIAKVTNLCMESLVMLFKAPELAAAERMYAITSGITIHGKSTTRSSHLPQ